jgi:two-component system, NarL family, sensor histidine kinase BarA
LAYRTFHRVFAETSLERKCRWWFGISLGLLIFLSFYVYGKRSQRLVFDQSREAAKEMVRAAFTEAHSRLDPAYFRAVRMIEETGVASSDIVSEEIDKDTQDYRAFMQHARHYGTDFRWEAILPPNKAGKNPPVGDTEERLFAQYSAIKLPKQIVGDEPTTGYEIEALPKEAEPFDRIVTRPDGGQDYQYYRPIYARRGCVICHKWTGAGQPHLEEGELLAIMRISFDHGPTAERIAENSAMLWMAAIITGFLSMFLLWFVVRFVIVRPVKHLRDVSNAVREGDVNQRAEIYTGDEFEELAAAFNRMVRQLLRQKDELMDVNGELDGKLDELAQANMRLYEMNRLKSDFLATMSHELRTPLNSILGFSEVLSGIDALNEKQKRYVGNIQRSGALLLEMINEILDLAKIESGRMDVRPTHFSIATVLSALCDMARPLAEKKNIDLEFSCEPNLPPVEQDQAKLQQIVNNLLSNAIKFTPEGGRIDMAVRRDEVGDIELKVRDTGIGISESEQGMVFEKFRQGTAVLPGGDAMTREHSGTGLGLSIVRELCRLLGGDVSLQSAVGKGSTFTVVLPWKVAPSQDLDAQLKEQVAALARPVLSDYVTAAPHALIGRSE